ncbi:MAG: NAD-dependent epimerase/dehydratase family protein [bacterium]
MKILITGGAGFIGSHITDRFIEMDHDVVIVDDLSTGKEEYINPKATFHKVDITDSDSLMKVFEAEKPQIVGHLAAQVNVRVSMVEPDKDAMINIMGSLNVLKGVVSCNIKKLIFSSTGGAIYGEPENLPVSEKARENPLSPYGLAKLTVENYIKVICNLQGIPYTILRYANVYGPRQIVKGESGVIAIFTQRMLEGKTPVIFGDGSHSRDYVFVSDVVNANVLALENGNGRTYNIGTGERVDVNEVYQKLEEHLKSGVKPEYGDEIPGEVHHIALDCGLIEKELGWTPEFNFDEGVKATIKYYREIV